MKLFLKFLFLLTPFFDISMLLAMTPNWEEARRRHLALRVGLSALIITLVVLFFGHFIFDAFGITVDAFRIGGGLLLMLSGVGLVNSKSNDKAQGTKQDEYGEDSAIAVVPLAIPIMVGPGTIAALLLVGSELHDLQGYISSILSLVLAVISVTAMLYVSGWMERKLGQGGLAILSKLTGLILVAMGSQLIAVGLQAFFPAACVIPHP